MKVLAKVNKRAWPYLFILPWIIGFLVFTLGPLVLSFVMSFFDWSITGTPKFRGLGNYIEMFTTDDQVLKSLSISLKYAAIFVPLNMIIALVLAMLISQPVKGAKFFRTIFYIPAVISGVAVSIIFGWLLNGNYGVINYLLSLLGIDGPQWLVDPKWAIIAVIFASAFGVGSMMLIFYTDIKNIPIDLYEAAAIDGVNAWQKFWKITFPLIGPFFTINLVLSMKNALGTFDQVVALTEGGPNSSTETVTYLIWKGGLTGGEYAYQTANAVLFFIVLAIIAFVQLRISRSQEQI